MYLTYCLQMYVCGCLSFTFIIYFNEPRAFHVNWPPPWWSVYFCMLYNLWCETLFMTTDLWQIYAHWLRNYMHILYIYEYRNTDDFDKLVCCLLGLLYRLLGLTLNLNGMFSAGSGLFCPLFQNKKRSWCERGAGRLRSCVTGVSGRQEHSVLRSELRTSTCPNRNPGLM